MEVLLKKYQQKYRKVREEMGRWDELQHRLLSQFRNASSIIERLPLLMEDKNYGALGSIQGIKENLVGTQMDALERIFSSMKDTMRDFNDIVISLGKISRDCHHQVKGLSLNMQQMKLRIGIRPSIEICLDGLKTIYEMHQSEYILKLSLISTLTCKSSAHDITTMRQLLADQPNIPKDEVELIFDLIFAEDIS